MNMLLEDQFHSMCKMVWHRGYRACRKKILTIIGQRLADAVTHGRGLDRDEVRRLYNSLRNSPIVYPGPQNPYSLGSGGRTSSDASRATNPNEPPEGVTSPVDGSGG